MSMWFAFAVLLAMAAAQCDFAGKTYASGSVSITFGAAVGNWWPVLINPGDPSHVLFASVKKATPTSNRWEVQTFGAANGEFCGDVGQYNAAFASDCSSLTWTALVADPCEDRGSWLTENVFWLVDVDHTATDADCITVGRVLWANYGVSEAAPLLSTEPVVWVFGFDEFAIASVGFSATFQRWSINYSGDSHLAGVRDYISIPDGLACGEITSGVYNATWGPGCAVRFCGVEEGCVARGELLHSTAVNGWEAPDGDTGCYAPVKNVGWGGESKCSIGDQQWLGHPYDCVNQKIDGGCMFCRGIAHERTVSLCLDRQGALCDDIFETDARKMYCNLEFECPASVATFSLALFISAFLALFFH